MHMAVKKYILGRVVGEKGDPGKDGKPGATVATGVAYGETTVAEALKQLETVAEQAITVSE